VNKHQETVTN